MNDLIAEAVIPIIISYYSHMNLPASVLNALDRLSKTRPGKGDRIKRNNAWALIVLQLQDKYELMFHSENNMNFETLDVIQPFKAHSLTKISNKPQCLQLYTKMLNTETCLEMFEEIQQADNVLECASFEAFKAMKIGVEDDEILGKNLDRVFDFLIGIVNHNRLMSEAGPLFSNQMVESSFITKLLRKERTVKTLAPANVDLLLSMLAQVQAAYAKTLKILLNKMNSEPILSDFLRCRLSGSTMMLPLEN